MSTFSEKEKIQMLADIVEINTVNDNEIEVARYLKKLFEDHGINAEIDEIEDKRVNLIASIGEGSPVVGVSGHMDVVSEGEHNDWDYPPFEMTEKDGLLYGRGTSDMKAGLMGLAIAMIEIKESGALPKGTIKFMATAGEEMEQLGSAQLYEKGYMNDVDALIIAEPSEQNIVYAHKGSMDFKITSKGRAAHSSVPVIGQNAIKPLIQFIQNIDEEYERISKELKYEKLDFSHLIDRLQTQLQNNDELDEEEVKRVISGLVISNTIFHGGNQVNSVPDVATADFNIRTVPEYDNNKVKELFKKYIEEINKQGGQLEEDMYLDLNPVLTTGDNDLIKVGQQVAKNIFGEDIVASPTVGVTDASNLLRDKDENFPFLMFGPGTVPHQVNEHVDKEKYLKFIDYYTELLTTYLKQYN
ncbi:succinyl-diaminopimelate desuccinylase [Staphylococcus petrasii]|uniref:Probable succinyl-diaminopimelate desuccinylase n=1 Tax=Staphylococcus petrasii TaxID=1276936 RepID=A0A380FUU4_9STAP|nr:ArgE/DapE family deacylase [Staphylococcus petrasii]PNZ30522.1 succinyl-diaminopimelate desuccinylase [Staphylococcus petrasii]TGE12167.1 ArgE/DapE family deacylase [Staphylococcus petrasii]TGE17069.1 ArgE/DapE family deacylase [Staphylococcus petrasii]SUM42649.1 succinyl-diaminopimelate desuccinylase [Staphylococcus petrasii]